MSGYCKVQGPRVVDDNRLPSVPFSSTPFDAVPFLPPFPVSARRSLDPSCLDKDLRVRSGDSYSRCHGDVTTTGLGVVLPVDVTKEDTHVKHLDPSRPF